MWRFKDRLPRESHYKTALAMDRELALALLDLEKAREESGEERPDPVPTPLGYSLDTYLLLAIVDALMGVQAAVIAAAGADPPTITPMQRPATAMDVVREERRLDSMQDLINLFTPASEDLP